jgi:hypothetical protein
MVERQPNGRFKGEPHYSTRPERGVYTTSFMEVGAILNNEESKDA